MLKTSKIACECPREKIVLTIDIIKTSIFYRIEIWHSKDNINTQQKTDMQQIPIQRINYKVTKSIWKNYVKFL